jgi:plastocyanin
MKKMLLIVFAAVFALAGGASTASSDSTATVNVAITATGFVPQNIAIDEDDTVVWRNTDAAEHQIVSNTGAFAASPVLQTGESYSVDFNTPSAYSYHDARKPSNTGTIVVRGTGATVTVGISRLRTVYRNQVRVFGGISNARAGESIQVRMTRYGGTENTRTVTTGSDGTFSFMDRPLVRTGYRAIWRNGMSRQEPFVHVRPLVVFNVLSARLNRYRVQVRAARSYGRKIVHIQRLNNRGTWVTAQRVRLNRFGKRVFRGNMRPGVTRARAWVQQAPGYAVGFSVTKRITR